MNEAAVSQRSFRCTYCCSSLRRIRYVDLRSRPNNVRSRFLATSNIEGLEYHKRNM